MRCIHCQEQFALATALDLGEFSWPEMHALWFECPSCATGNHLKVGVGRAEHIRILGAPGPDWEVLSEESAPSLDLRADPSFLHVWHHGQHYVFPAIDAVETPAARPEPDSAGWLVVGAGTLFLLGLLTLAPLPVVIAPYSFVLIAPGLLAASQFGAPWFFVGVLAGALIAPLAFLHLTAHALRAGRPLPKRSLAAFGVVACLSWTEAVLGWGSTVLYTSHARALALILQATLPPLLIIGSGLAIRRSFTPRRSLLFHWLALAWFVWGAFPWYGELM